MFGNVALKTHVYGWTYAQQFGNEINWGDAIVLVRSFLHDLYDDTIVMASSYEQMTDFIDYIQREEADGCIVEGALGDWVKDHAGGETSGLITGI